MSDQTGSKTRECISAMVDNEASELELFRTSKELSEDDELKRTWHRYHLISLAMRRQTAVTTVDLSEQIARAVALEPEMSADIDPDISDSISSSSAHKALDASPDQLHSKNTVASNGLFRKFAVAASVAVVAVFGVQQLELGPDSLNKSTNSIADYAAPAAGVSAQPTDNPGPQFQMPSGFALPQINTRTVSTGSSQGTQGSFKPVLSSQNHTQKDADRQIQNYLSRMMLQHATQVSSISYVSVPEGSQSSAASLPGDSSQD